VGKLSNNPDAYFRAGVAIQKDRKPVFDERLAKLGLRTIGDLATFFITADGVVEALLPLLPAYREKQKHTGKSLASTRKQAIDAVKNMTPEQLEKILAAAVTTQKKD
jgi:hypothetical protein